MAHKRIELQKILEDFMVSCDYKPNVFFQPPSNHKLTYPVIIYELQNYRINSADNKSYFKSPRYAITIISQKADEPMVDKILDLGLPITYDRHFDNDNIYHNTYDVYF